MCERCGDQSWMERMLTPESITATSKVIFGLFHAASISQPCSGVPQGVPREFLAEFALGMLEGQIRVHRLHKTTRFTEWTHSA